MARKHHVQGHSDLLPQNYKDGQLYWNILHSQCNVDIRKQQVTGVHGSYALLAKNGDLGEGGEGLVKKGINLNTNEQVAVKIISKAHSEAGENHHLCEIQILHIISHPNIISVIESIESDIFVYTIMELGSNDLMHKLEAKIYGEDLAKIVAKDVFYALDYLHKAGICHRDIKPENIIYCKSGRECWKLADFGIATFFTEQSPQISGNIGTFEYMAPEMTTNQYYTKAVDSWGAGVTLFSVLVYELPWDSEKDKEQQIIGGMITWTNNWDRVSIESRDFIERLLKLNEAERMTSNEALKHPWLSV